MRCLFKMICMYSILMSVTISAMAQASAPITAIKAGRLIDPETATVTTNAIILIEGERVKAVGANLAIPAGATIIDPCALQTAAGLARSNRRTPSALVQRPVWIEKIATLASEQTGIFYPLVKRGTYVEQGMKIGYVTDYHGNVTFEARAAAAGIVLYICAVPSMTKVRRLRT